MGVKDSLKKVFTKEKKLVICGLDYSGKSTFCSFLQNGTFKEHSPTLGKEMSTIEIQEVRINLMDLGGEEYFRNLWIGEASTADCLIFMIDAYASERFNEAKNELWKLSSIFMKKPLIVLANKQDLEPISSLSEIIDSLDLKKLPNFEIIPISAKTGYGIVNAFMKMYYKLTGKQLTRKISPEALTVFDKGGVPLTSSSHEDIFQGGLFAAITSFARKSFNSELDQLKIEENVIIFKRTEHLLGSIVLSDNDKISIEEAEKRLYELLVHLEYKCPELKQENLEPGKIDYLVKQYASNLL